MKTILITGGAGFIGSNFAKRIHRTKDWRIIILDAMTYAGNLDNIIGLLEDRNRVEFYQGDVCDSDLVYELVSRSDFIVHFAAETHVARSLSGNRKFYQTDIEGTVNICNAVVRFMSRIEKFIYISTSEVYGSAVREPMDEDHPLLPETPYASAKAGADRAVFSFYRSFGIPAVLVRPFNNYGPHQHLEKFLPRTITSVLLGEKIVLHGDGNAARDWVFVDDTVDAVLDVLDHSKKDIFGEVFNVATGRAVSVKELARMVVRLMVGEEDIEKFVSYGQNRSGQVEKHIGGNEKAHRHLAWRPRYGLEEGLKRTIDWYSANRPWWEKQLHLRVVPVRMSDGTLVYW